MDSRSPVKPMVVPSEGENDASASSAAFVTSMTLQPSAMSAVTSMYRRWLRRRMLERLSVSSTVAMSLSATECTGAVLRRHVKRERADVFGRDLVLPGGLYADGIGGRRRPKAR